MTSTRLTGFEMRVSALLGCIFATRLLGLFMILPVFALYANQLPDATPMLIGIAMGSYGLTQACLQIPFGMASDHFGRKRIIILGLIIFAIGSLIAAFSHGIVGIIIGRALQGAGAIGSTIMALLADLTAPEQRSKSMAILGIIIGLSFTLAMGLGPLLNTWVGVPGIFIFTALLAFGGIILLHYKVPNPQREMFHRDAEVEPTRFKQLLVDKELFRLNIGILILHAMLTACFIVIPVILSGQHWGIYCGTLVLSVFVMFPFLRLSQRQAWFKPLFISAIVLLLITQIIFLSFNHNIALMIAGLFLFFIAFTYLEATLPALVSRVAPANSKGSAMGIYSTFQFSGIFLGGVIGGWLSGHLESTSIFVGSALALITWIFFASSMKNPSQVSHFMLNLNSLTPTNAEYVKQQLLSIRGVVEATVCIEDGVAYLKIDKACLDENKLHNFSIY